MKISIRHDPSGHFLHARTPYHPEFIRKVKGLKARWDPVSRTWRVDVRYEGRLRAICRTIFGTDGSGDEAQDLVAVRLELQGMVKAPEAYLFGKQIMRRPGRASRVRLGEDVVLLEGEFASRGGSRKRPEIGDVSGVALEVRDVLRHMAQRALENLPGWVAKAEIVE